MFQRLNNFFYRGRKRLCRELRNLGGGIDVSYDAWWYRQTRSGKNGRDRVLQWATLAPWGGELRSQTALSDRACPEEIAALIAAADRACAHEFDLLGSGLFQFGERIDWHLDFKSGYRWDVSIHHSRIGWGTLPAGVDIKVPWELSRCMHFAALGLADAVTGDARYYQEWKAQLSDWIASNPVGHGVNWTCAMDVAMRAVNWLNAVMCFQQRIERDTDEAFFKLLCESLWHHGLHIERRLEWAGPHGALPGNHFLADLTGLLAIGAFFQTTGTGRRWWRFAKHWLEHEMFRQVNPDGTNYETSTSYHRMVMEMFLWADTLAEGMEDPFSDGYRERLGLMADFVSAYSTPGGSAAQFGDNDSGRLLWAGLDDGLDHRYLTKGECGFGGNLNRFLLAGGLPMPGNLPSGDTGFPDGGYYFMSRGPAWIGLRSGAVSHGGAHAHCDQLSLVLSLAGQEILVDRGTGIYTPDPDKRNHYRSTESHNTIRVNDWEQNLFGKERHQVFQMPDHCRASVTRWEPENGIWEAAHSGFEREIPGMHCSRHIRLVSGCLKIRDTLTALRDGDRVEWFFHFAPGVELDLMAHQVSVRAGAVEVRFSWNSDVASEILSETHSPAYGVEVPAQCLRLALRAKNPQTTETFEFGIHWSKFEEPANQ